MYNQWSFSNVKGISAVYNYNELRKNPVAFVIFWKM